VKATGDEARELRLAEGGEEERPELVTTASSRYEGNGGDRGVTVVEGAFFSVFGTLMCFALSASAGLEVEEELFEDPY